MIFEGWVQRHDLSESKKIEKKKKCLVHLRTGNKLHFYINTVGTITHWVFLDDEISSIVKGDIFEEKVEDLTLS